MTDLLPGIREGDAGTASALDSARRDLTTAHADIADARERHRYLRESMNEPVGGLGLEGQFVFCNAALVSALRYGSGASLFGLDGHGVLHGARGGDGPCEEPARPVARAFAERAALVVDDAILSRADGTSFFADLSISAVPPEGKVSGCVSGEFRRPWAPAGIFSRTGPLPAFRDRGERRP